MYNSVKSAISNLTPKFNKARQSGALYFFDSEVKDVEQNERRFQIRICPALLDKSKAKAEAEAKVRAQQANSTSDGTATTTKDNAEEKEKSSPFEPPYVEDLFVGELEGLEGEDGMVVLYAVLPEHFLLVSKVEEPQNSPPTPHELLQAYNMMYIASQHPSDPRRLLAFYNGGAGAGASQSWRHLQLISVHERLGAPIETWMRGVKPPGRQGEAFAHPSLPYLHLVYPLPAAQDRSFPPTEEEDEYMLGVLAKGMMSLLDDMIDAVRRNEGSQDGGWNLLITLDHMHLIPRSHPSFPLPQSLHADTECKDPSPLEVNSLGYAGMLLVKSPAELEALEKITSDDLKENADGHSQGIMGVLEYCGVPRHWGDKPEEAHGGADQLMSALKGNL
ncbi:hypothetical protein QFC22_002379 [Naganishia vaughanmartiniae]|uniref:Uncharacterized protein n=1 Tax=Naganishia vaughanmartiniae TaxID=1424756 RepID=A0ACC2XGA6_9TREE|nr:hypothetical protein QFC22_002379 [Naganishia vaughanmartiniae]